MSRRKRAAVEARFVELETRASLLHAAVAALRTRVDELEAARRRDRHCHEWTYGKEVDQTPRFGGPSVVWSWRCAAPDCPEGDGWTNFLAGLPAHYPEALR